MVVLLTIIDVYFKTSIFDPVSLPHLGTAYLATKTKNNKNIFGY